MLRDTTAPAPADPPPRRGRFNVGDDLAYFLPMAVFLLIMSAGSLWEPLYPYAYVARTIIVAVLLVLFWRHYTKIRWDYWWLGAIVGVIGIFQWVPMQLWLQNNVEFFHVTPEEMTEAFNPFRDVPGPPAAVWAFIAVRLIGAVLVVPVMEELFWRDFLWRQILAPNDFKLARVGEWHWAPYLGVSAAFALVHGNWWLTAIVWALMVGALLVYTKSLGACIIAHAVTNLLLGVYVLREKAWFFW